LNLTRTETSREIAFAENRGRALASKIADDVHTNRPAGKLAQFVDDEADDPIITLAGDRRGQVRSYEHLDTILKTGPDPIDLPADIRTQLLAERAGWLTTDQAAALRRLPTTAPTTRPPGRPQMHTRPPGRTVPAPLNSRVVGTARGTPPPPPSTATSPLPLPAAAAPPPPASKVWCKAVLYRRDVSRTYVREN